MPLYEDASNAINHTRISEESIQSIIIGTENVVRQILSISKPGSLLALDGWMGVDYAGLSMMLQDRARQEGIPICIMSSHSMYRCADEIREYKNEYITDDPSFGFCNQDGRLSDLMDPERIALFAEDMKRAAKSKAVVVIGTGAAIPELAGLYTYIYYFDMTRQPLLWKMWDGKLKPMHSDEIQGDYCWKEYYYCDYYLLHHQKSFLLDKMSFYVEAIHEGKYKLLPRPAYDEMIATALKYPIKEVKIFQPGPWGAYRYKDLFDVPGLECNAWNELAGPELSILLDVGASEPINVPFVALLQYPKLFVGEHISNTYPNLFPLDIWLDDGYFPTEQPAERISMPLHNHPGTDYVKRHFNEPLGRYETYYIAEAYQGSNTWMGYSEDADLEAWERACRESNNQSVIDDWKSYVTNWNSAVGDLFLIPPGTVHGHGGNQMVLEMDTCPSIAGTEYSFFTYDFARNSWDDNTKTMTGKPLKMHLEHSFDNDKFRRAEWVKNHLLAKPKVTEWTREYCRDQYESLPEMPFHIERLHFYNRGENDTQMRFLHILTLTVGEKVIVRSKSDPRYHTDIELFQSVVVPASFGEYEVINASKGFCTVVQLRWKEG